VISLGTVTVKLNLPLLFYRKFAKRQGQLSKVTCKPARPQQPGVTKQHTKRPPPLAPSVFYVFFFSCAHDSHHHPVPCSLSRRKGNRGVAGRWPASLPTCPLPSQPRFASATAASLSPPRRRCFGCPLRSPGREAPPGASASVQRYDLNFALLRSGGVLPFQSGFARSP
jgi:hypothetical protein